MSEKYIELKPQIVSDYALVGATAVQGGVGIALEWLDRHPDQVPGRTITESEISKAFGTEYVAFARLCLARIGITVVPDPEPTDVEKITRLILENSTDMDPKFIAEMLVENGVRPVKSGGNDDQ